jgi:diketogulonate reductase-like aldo/keto reductase
MSVREIMRGTTPHSYARAHGVVMQSYSPLGNNASALLQGPLLQRVGAAHGKSTAQVALQWVLSHGAAVVSHPGPGPCPSPARCVDLP